MVWRRRAYRKGRLASYRPSVPVISVGNLVVGGTGKTPLVIWLARALAAQGRRPAILSRGYGRPKGPGYAPEVLVSLGEGPLVPSGAAGDEPYLIARQAPGSLVLVGTRRAALARRAQELKADCLLLDDGLQHLALQRDFEIVVCKVPQLLGNGLVLPAGPLREPPPPLDTPAALVLTGSVAEPRPDRTPFGPWAAELPIFQAFYRPGALYLWADGAALAPAEVGPLAAFCGLGQPAGFHQTLREAGLQLAGTWNWPDHHQYRPGDLERLADWAETLKAPYLVTTEKDAVKIAPTHPLTKRLLVLPLILELDNPQSLLDLVSRFGLNGDI